MMSNNTVQKPTEAETQTGIPYTENCALLVDTPLQIFNSIHFIYTYHLVGKTDLYVVMQFQKSQQIIERLQASHLFRHVYALKREYKGKLRHFRNLLGLMAPNAYCKKVFGIDIRAKQYTAVFTCAVSKPFDFFIGACRKVHVYGSDDGIGSYYGNIYLDHLSRFYYQARKFFGNDWHVEALFLNNPEVCRSSLKCPVYPVDTSLDDPDKRENLFTIFDYQHTPLYQQHHFIYLNQPILDVGEGNFARQEMEVVRLLQKTADDELIIRLHPREQDEKRYAGCTVDHEENMWELLCGDVITDQHVLIGEFSTTQFVPKLLYNREPHLVFTYPLFDKNAGGFNPALIQMIDNLRQSYKHPERIHTVTSLKELSELVAQLEKTL